MNYDRMHLVFRRATTWIALAAAPFLSLGAIAQETNPAPEPAAYPNCEAPAAGEYLLLIQGDVEAAQAQLGEAFPEGADVTVCTYIDSVITRVGGFSDAETAAAWAQYLSDLGNLEAFVARPPQETPQETPTEDAPAAEEPASEPEDAPAAEPLPPEIESEPEPAEPEPPEPAGDAPDTSDAETVDPATSEEVAEPAARLAFPAPTLTAQPPVPEATLVQDGTPVPPPEGTVNAADEAADPETPIADAAYQPQILGDGYAVLVHYFDDPQVALTLQQTLGRPVGVVSYNQQPYLLATHTTDGVEAGEWLTLLSTQYTTLLVDSRAVVLLSDAVAAVPESGGASPDAQ
jgi:hypothetical protein